MVINTVAPWAELVPDVDHPMTADELLTLPEDDGWRYELVAGRLVRMPPTGVEHDDVGAGLQHELFAFVVARRLGRVTLSDVGFRLDRAGEKHIVLAPDIAFVSAERLAQLPPRGTPERKKFFPFAPDLAVEVASPDQYRPEMAQKARLYLAAGTRLLWLVWPGSRQVDIWRPGNDQPVTTLTVGNTLDGEEVVPGFTFPVARLFG